MEGNVNVCRFGKLTPRKHICNIWGWGKFDKLSKVTGNKSRRYHKRAPVLSFITQPCQIKLSASPTPNETFEVGHQNITRRQNCFKTLNGKDNEYRENIKVPCLFQKMYIYISPQLENVSRVGTLLRYGGGPANPRHRPPDCTCSVQASSVLFLWTYQTRVKETLPENDVNMGKNTRYEAYPPLTH